MLHELLNKLQLRRLVTKRDPLTVFDAGLTTATDNTSENCISFGKSNESFQWFTNDMHMNFT